MNENKEHYPDDNKPFAVFKQSERSFNQLFFKQLVPTQVYFFVKLL
jgi:hypothetical protein